MMERYDRTERYDSGVDVVFVMDSSGSVGSDNWNTAKTFAKNIISNFQIGPNDIQFGFVTIGSQG